MKEVTIENGGTPISDINDEQCTHIVINDQEVKQVPLLTDATTATSSLLSTSTNEAKTTSTSSIATTSSISTSCNNNTNQLTPTHKSSATNFNPSSSPFSNTRASIVRAEWFWASIQICCRASECLYEFTKPKVENTIKVNIDPPTKRIKLSVDNLLSHETLNGNMSNNHHNTSSSDSPHNQRQSHSNHTPTHHSNVRVSNSHISNTSITNNNHSKNSSNNLLTSVLSSVGLCNSNNNNNNCNGANANLDCDSPTLTNHINGRLSSGLYGNMNRNNISNNNLSTSASLLDATADDVMSSMFIYLNLN